MGGPSRVASYSFHLSRPILPQHRHPLKSRPLIPLLKRLLAVLLESLSIAVVYLHEVSDYFVVVEFALVGEEGGETDVFDVVAPFAEGDEALQGLDVLLVVVVPDFVAFELASSTTDAAAVVIRGVDLPAQLVPLHA